MPASFVSDWQAADITKNNILTFPHTLNRPPTSISVLFSADKATVYTCHKFTPYAASVANPFTISADMHAVFLYILADVPLHWAWNDITISPPGQNSEQIWSEEAWTSYKAGYYMVSVD